MEPRLDRPPIVFCSAALLLAFTASVPLLAAVQEGPEPQGAEPPTAAQAPEIVWDFEQGDYQFSEVVAGEGVVFALDRGGKIHALDMAEGDLMWSSEGKESFSYGFGFDVVQRPGLDAVVVSSDTGLFALDRLTGNEIWRTEIEQGVNAPAVAAEAIVAGSASGFVYGFDIETGKVLWKTGFMDDAPDDPPGFDGERARSPDRAARPQGTVADGKLAVISIFDQCRILAFDTKTGVRRWSFDSQGWVGAVPTIGPDVVMCCSQDKHVYAIDRVTGELRWKKKTGGRISAPAAIAGDSVFVGSCDARLYRLDLKTGEEQWRFEVDHKEGFGASVYSQPLVLGNTVHLAAMAGTVYAVDCTTGALEWRLTPFERSEINSDIATDGKRLVFTTRKGRDPGGAPLGESTVVALEAPKD